MVPGDPESLQLDEVADPEPGPDELLVEMVVAGICGTDHEILEGDIGYPASGRDRLVLGHEALGRVSSRPAGKRLRPGRSGGADRAPPRPGPVPQLRRRRMGHVPQRPFHRGRDQGSGRLHRREAVALPSSFAVKVSSRPRALRRAGGAGQRGGQGMGAHHPSREPRAVGTGASAGDRGGPDRPLGHSLCYPAGRRGSCSRPGQRRAQTGSGPRSGGRSTTARAWPGSREQEYDVVVECTGDADLMVAVVRCDQTQRDRLSRRGHRRGASVIVTSDIARAIVLRESNRLRDRQRQPQALRRGSSGAGPS